MAFLNVFRSSNFAPAFFLLSPARRRALKAVYAFCRDVDDVVDRTSDPVGAHQFLQGWRTILEQPCTAEAPNLVTPEIWAALEDVLRNHKVDPKHLLALVDGVERDLFKKRYATFEELKTYCHGVASTVGLACLPIFGLDEPAHSKFAVNLGLAVQMINILRDVKEDAARGTIYLPQEDMKRFGYNEPDLLKSVHNPDFVRLMRFEGARAKELYAQALQNLPAISRPLARPALVMGRIYRVLLKKIEQADYNVFAGRISLTPWEKMRCVGKVLWEEWSK